jgi:hypothetical protein
MLGCVLPHVIILSIRSPIASTSNSVLAMIVKHLHHGPISSLGGLHISRGVGNGLDRVRSSLILPEPPPASICQSENDAKLAQKLGQLQPFTAVFPPECMGQFAYFGPT